MSACDHAAYEHHPHARVRCMKCGRWGGIPEAEREAALVAAADALLRAGPGGRREQWRQLLRAVAAYPTPERPSERAMREAMAFDEELARGTGPDRYPPILRDANGNPVDVG